MPIRLFLVSVLLSVGCASTPKKEETLVVPETKVEKEPMDLKKCPCGRTDWDQYPPGHKKAPK